MLTKWLPQHRGLISSMAPLAWTGGHLTWKSGHLSWGCPTIYDVSVAATLWKTVNTQTLGIWISVGSEAWPYSFLYFGRPILGGWGGTGPGGGTYTDGDRIQITVKRTGADCTATAGSYYSDTFGSSLDSGWTAQTGTFSTAAGRLQCNTATAPAGRLRREFNAVSNSATYTVKYCLNGVQQASSSATIAFSTIGDPYIRAGVMATPAIVADPIAEFDDFKLDIDL